MIGVVPAWTLARQRHLSTVLAADAATPLAVAGGLILWLVRLALAPASTVSGFRAWVLAECPVAPAAALPARPRHRRRFRGRRPSPPGSFLW